MIRGRMMQTLHSIIKQPRKKEDYFQIGVSHLSLTIKLVAESKNHSETAKHPTSDSKDTLAKR